MESTDIVRIIIEVALPVVVGVAGFIAGRRKRDNDFLSELQSSIDMLSAKNREQIDEIIKLREQVVKVREENLELSKSQEKLIRENTELRAEVNRLREENQKQCELIMNLQEQLSCIKTITRK